MVQGGMMLGTVFSQVLVSWFPIVAEVFLGEAASEPPEAHVHGIEHFFTMVLLVMPVAVELSH